MCSAYFSSLQKIILYLVFGCPSLILVKEIFKIFTVYPLYLGIWVPLFRLQLAFLVAFVLNYLGNLTSNACTYEFVNRGWGTIFIWDGHGQLTSKMLLQIRKLSTWNPHPYFCPLLCHFVFSTAWVDIPSIFIYWRHMTSKSLNISRSHFAWCHDFFQSLFT